MRRTGRKLLVVLGAVLLLAGGAACGSDVGNGTAGGNGNGNGNGNGDGNGDVIVVLGSEYEFDPSEITVGTEFTLELQNVGIIEHDFTIEDVDDPEHADHVLHAMPGESARGTYELEEGAYTFFCSIPGHRELGMEGTVTVSE